MKFHTKVISLFIIIGLSALALLASAGSLTPPGSPASTMRTLGEIYDSIASTTWSSDGLTASSTGSAIQILKHINDSMPSVETHATDCTALTTGDEGDLCVELDSERLFSCQPTSGVCDSAAEWVLTGERNSYIWSGGTEGTLSTGSTQYFTVVGIGPPVTAGSGLAGNYYIFNPAMTPTFLGCTLQTAPGSGKSRTLSLYATGSGTTDWSCTISDSATFCGDSSGSAISSQHVLFETVPSNTPAASQARCNLFWR